MDAIRELAKHLEVVTKATLLDRVREYVKDGTGTENVSVALEDAENLVNPVLPAPIFSAKARQLSLNVKYLSSLGDYCNQRVLMLDEIQHLTSEEAEAISGRLAERLGDLLIFEVLVDNADGDKVLARQVRLWQMFHMALEEGQMQLAPYFLALDENETVQSLLPCCIPMGAPAKVTCGSRKKVWWQCPEGHVWKAAIYARAGPQKCGCPVCAGRVKSHKYAADTVWPAQTVKSRETVFENKTY